MKAVIHCNPHIPWQPIRAAYFAEGFKAAGVNVEITADRFRHDDGFPVLLGTTTWRDIENDDGDFLLVDRCSFGDTEKFVSLVWNGHGRRGDHRIPENYDSSRWEKHGVSIDPWRDGGDRVLLCGQVDTYSPHYSSIEDWYAGHRFEATHFRPHPAGDSYKALPTLRTFDGVREAITLNSSIGVQCVLAGICTQTWDEGSMAWDMKDRKDREPWCHWLAWTQWSDDEIRKGVPWAFQL